MNQQQLRKIEFGVATGIFLLALINLLGPSFMSHDGRISADGPYAYQFAQYHQVYDYYLHFVLPAMGKIVFLYLSFVAMNFLVGPYFFEKGKWVAGAMLSFQVCLILFVALLVTNSYTYGYMLGRYATTRGAHMQFTKMAFLSTAVYAILYVVYYVFKTAYAGYLHRWVTEKLLPAKGAKELLIMGVTWAALVAVTFSVTRQVIFFGGPVVMTVYYFTQYRIFPEYETHHNKRVLWRDLSILLLMANTCMVVLFALVSRRYANVSVPMGLLSLLFCVILILPLFWMLFKSRLQQQATVSGLQKALGHSAANLDFLRTQINPHFLFNALNTLYGTALQEEAPRTSEGIQKLGDMMRFMLHDNHLEKIPLDKEVAYLQNYIDLQRLRVLVSPDIKIDVNIDETNCHHDIAPMLLIPFVENAFKHGISLRNKSSIVISMSCNHDKIFFDVYNTVHARPENDPEKHSLGIGLNNVKERLVLLYPDKHELSIRQTATGFFVHLTIDVN